MTKMEVVLTTTLGELVSRCLSFLINKYSMPSAPSREERLQRLERMLLRVGVVVEEAEGRCITNQAMLRQLSTLRGEMLRGYYLLDVCRYLAHGEGKKAKDLQLSSPSAALNPGKRVAFSDRTTQDMTRELKQILGSVEALITDMNEFVIFLNNYPPICRQPYNMHLVLERCMFGRQVEMERIISFLLQREPRGEDHLGVLPIVGKKKVGKSTLVEHACCDVRVRDYFSQILFFRGDKFIEEKLYTLKDGGMLKYQNSTPNNDKMLFVIELDGDVDEGAWRRLYPASRGSIPSGSKIIITSPSEKIIKFGTTQALWLKSLCRDASWYFFKVLVFGSMDSKEHPKLASIAMEIFEEYFDQDALMDFSGPFATSKGIAEILRANVSTRYWRRALTCIRGNWQRNTLEFGDTSVENEHLHMQRLAKLTQYCVVDRHIRIGLAHEEIPKIILDDVTVGSVTPKGRFEVVVWKSHLSPYYSYITSCEVRESKLMPIRNKNCKKRKKSC